MKQMRKQMKNETSAQTRRVRNSTRCSSNGALVASRAASSSAVGLTTGGTRRFGGRGHSLFQAGKRIGPLDGIDLGAQPVELGGAGQVVKILAQSADHGAPFAGPLSCHPHEMR